MKLSEIIQLQKDFDYDHGWSLKSDNIDSKLDQITKDLVGIVGELGEFSNLVKKINLINDAFSKEETLLEFDNSLPDMKEELTDTFIYLMRLSTHLKMDIEEEYLKKLIINKERFRKYEKK